MKLAQLNGKPEIFYSIQGEGKNTGQPSIFIRTSLCNLHCIWCDTDYTWNWEGTPFPHQKDQTPGYHKYNKEEYIAERSIQEITKTVKDIPCENIVLTGGEPLMQQSALCDLILALRSEKPTYHFEIETNGTILPTPAFDALIDQYNVSPKLRNSANPQRLREKSDAYTFFKENPKAYFKFVITNQDDLEEIQQLINSYQLRKDRIYLMPEGTTSELLKAKQQWLVEVCKQHGYHFTDRLHIHIYGDKRGV